MDRRIACNRGMGLYLSYNIKTLMGVQWLPTNLKRGPLNDSPAVRDYCSKLPPKSPLTYGVPTQSLTDSSELSTVYKPYRHL